MPESIKILQDHEGLTDEAEIPAWPDTNRQDLPSILERLNNLLYEFGWIQNSVWSLQEHTGLEEGYYMHLPYRWEGPPLQTFQYRGQLYEDLRPVVPTSTGLAGQPSVLGERSEEGNWELVTTEQRGIHVNVGLESKFYI